ncbi:MAG: hypothetical protein C4527_01030 [Candidatus Omnitrophota bacterium]|jgi:type IV pilus assembly protein PilQ|nr:MAG: hypothetical protein C4527_01030 [Candidatus Omnitrophota bacterium]
MIERIFFGVLICCFVFSIPPLAAGTEENRQDLLFSSDGEAISINMPNLSLIDALRMLAKLTHVNLIVDESVVGSVNLYLQDVTPQEAWNALLQTKNLSFKQEGNLIYVFIPEQVTAESIPRETRIAKLKYITLGSTTLTRSGGRSSTGNVSTGADQTSSRQMDYGGGIDRELQEEGTKLDEILVAAFGEENLKVAKDIRTNHLLLTGTPMILDEVFKLLEVLDQPVSQLLIEAKVVQVRSQALKDQGIDWGGVYTFNNSGGYTFSYDRQRDEPGGIVTQSNQDTLQYTNNVTNFKVTLSALINDGDARVLFSPRVVTQNNKEAYIASGQEIQIPSGLDINGNTSFRERQVALELGVTPRVLANSLISLSIRVRNDTVNYNQPEISGVPPLDVNSVESFVTLRDSDMVIIGGILTTQDSNQRSRIPLLSDIPLLGSAFRNNSKRIEQSELIIVITPRIITNEEGFLIDETAGDAIMRPEQQDVVNDLMSHRSLWIDEAAPAQSTLEKDAGSNPVGKQNAKRHLNKRW